MCFNHEFKGLNMQMSKMFFQTYKEIPKDATISSHILMLRAGLISKHASGVYHYLPMGLKVLDKLKQLLNKEIEKTEAEELALSYLVVADLWKESGRYEKMANTIFKFQDRHHVDYLLGPTHEESIVQVVKGSLKSYKQLPINLFQTKRKFRDEIRPRYGVMRGREFTMMDGYSFHSNDQSLDEYYERYKKAYLRFFEKCDLKTFIVNADSGSMGGHESEEFMVKSNIGDDTIFECEECGYFANQEKAVSLEKDEAIYLEEELPLTMVATPNIQTIQDLVQFFDQSAKSMIKCIAVKTESEKIVLAFLRGDKDLNEAKLASFLRENFHFASEEEIHENVGPVGFLGAINIKNPEVQIVFDNLLEGRKCSVMGANQIDYHYKNVSLQRDFSSNLKYADISLVKVGDTCGQCLKGSLKSFQGIEVGHIFKLGKSYAQSLNLTYTSEKGQEQFPTMGCYGLGIDRTFAAIIEQHSDEHGIIFPDRLAPYQLIVSVLEKQNFEKAMVLYHQFMNQGCDVLLDDRDLSIGVKLKDADLMGIPFRITFGKKYLQEGLVGLKHRKNSEEMFITEQAAIQKVKDQMTSL